MLKWMKELARSPDHPLYNVAEAKKVLADLPQSNDVFALNELTTWLESILESDTFRPADRIGVIKLLDETAQPFLARMFQQYLTALTDRRGDPNANSLVMFGFARKVTEAYERCIADLTHGRRNQELIQAELPLLTTRALNALVFQKKWLQLRYRPIEKRIWADLFKFHAMAESAGFSQNPLRLYGGTAHSSPTRALLRALMSEISSLQSLTPLEMELADRLIEHYSGAFVFSRELSKTTPFYIDYGFAGPPRRVDNGDTPMLVRYFGPGTALLRLQEEIEAVGRAEIAPMLRTGNRHDTEILNVLNHLAGCWAPIQARRQHDREKVVESLQVVHGFEDIRRKIIKSAEMLSVLEGDGDISYHERLDLKIYGFITTKTLRKGHEPAGKSEDPDDENLEKWLLDDVSSNGIGAVVLDQTTGWAEVGAMVAFRRDKSFEWSIGQIRRLSRDAELKVHIGVLLLSDKPLAIRLKPMTEAKFRAWDEQAGTSSETITAIMLPMTGETMSIVAERNAFSPGLMFEFNCTGGPRRIKMRSLLKRGADFDWIAFEPVDGPHGSVC